MNNNTDIGAAIYLFVVVYILLYFIPSMVAFTKSRQNFASIFALNLFLGWSVLGWVAALVWALKTKSSNRDRVFNASSEYCAGCGAPLDFQAQFCSKCGRVLSTTMPVGPVLR